MKFNSLKQIRRIFVAIIGGTILFIGIILIVLPGPALIVIPVGLSILATEFVWAKILVEKFKHRFQSVKDKFKKKM
ncbi:MAG: PGPGW domain-containing protein [Melioribacteraceae bacterium]